MGELSAEQIAQRAYDLNLIDNRQMQAVWGELGTHEVPADDLLQLLVRRELLTNYQVERLVKGERSGYFYGSYKVLYRVATGSFARVYRSVDVNTNKIVALKVLRRRYCDDSAMTEQFYREGQMGRTLRHPNIVPIYDVVSCGTEHYLVMEFVEGHNLRDFVRIRKKIAPDESVKLMIDIANGMHYAFERGVTHRDLKLTNILVSSRGQAKLVDFGLAAADDRIKDGALADQENPRTIDYAGLERATGVRKDDQRSDIYFLGCILYHMLTGKAALQETKDRIQRLSRSRYTDVEPIYRAEPGLPVAVTAVVNKAMELDVSARYQTPAELLIDLKIASDKLASGDGGNGEADSENSEQRGLSSEAERQRWAKTLIPDSQRRAVMFVESDTRMQDIFRDGLKRSGYRVLLTSDPQRALDRFSADASAADCVVFSTGSREQRLAGVQPFW
ncbi:MAG: serine/threonine-protein kinase [Pirellulales bacterium]